jgi:hypothetical protein
LLRYLLGETQIHYHFKPKHIFTYCINLSGKTTNETRTFGGGVHDERRKYKDSSIVDMEQEEHIFRMKILSEKLYAAKLRRKQEELKLKMLQEDYVRRSVKVS